MKDKEYERDEIFEKNDLNIKRSKTENENFERLAKKMESNIQVVNQKILEDDIIINKGYDKTTYLVKTDKEKFMKVKSQDEIKEKIDRPNRNIKPVVHTNDKIKVLWGLERTLMERDIWRIYKS